LSEVDENPVTEQVKELKLNPGKILKYNSVVPVVDCVESGLKLKFMMKLPPEL
jgi:hypothetical protein